ncbi:MAG: phosphate ABC transporter substrate-binding protein PstS [Deltaproteobacteria bacterium]|nr:MAG: phosphate ABC transporter substrate-binding protein PstS [Deltaproteobacteria bacterium]
MDKKCNNLFRIILITLTTLLLTIGPAFAGGTINGAGATFPYPVYAQWAWLYNKDTGVKLNYQSIGSGGGIRQIKAKTVDFGASDAPLKTAELDEAGLLQFPMVIGGVVPVVNVPGVAAGKLKLSATTLANIFLGKINKWNDAAIIKENPGLALPDTAITVVHRADGSGTTWIFTSYLSKVSDEWKNSAGHAKSVKWPTGVGGKGNAGVAAYVQRIKGAIGYVEYAYALQNKLSYSLLQNQAGKYVAPTIATFQAAAINADWTKAEGFYLVLTDQPGEDSWPITGASFILVYKEQANAKMAKDVLSFFDWCYRKGGKTAEKLDYVPMPESVVSLVEKTWREQIKSAGKPVWP